MYEAASKRVIFVWVKARKNFLDQLMSVWDEAVVKKNLSGVDA
ncbi:MAG: hypothetical protein PWQ17_406 [Anaerophaga sp.]|nr:hypothetical protein [Anaerophaga sp.]MDN5289763.1 hypothetical protein [Anaerophaga sp.]